MTRSMLGRLSVVTMKAILMLNFFSNLSFSFVGSLRLARLAENRFVNYRSKLQTFRTGLHGSVSGSSYESVENLKELCRQFATESAVSSDTLGSKDGLLERIIQSLNETCFLTASTFGSFLLSSPFPANSIIFQGDNYALQLLTVPRGKEVFLSESCNGTALFYKPLLGSGELKTVQDLRKIDSVIMNGIENINTGNSDVVRKIGGVTRKFSCYESSPGSSILLELAFSRGRSKGSSVIPYHIPA